MASILQRKYPFELNDNPAKEGLLAAVIVFLILLFLQPFGISEYEGNKFIMSLAFGLVTFVCSVAMDSLIVVPLQKRAKPWRIWHHVLTLFIEILIIGLCNFLLSCILFIFPVELKSCLEILYWTSLIGIIVTVLSTTISYQRYMRGQLNSLLDKTTQEQEGIQVTIHDNRVRGNDVQLPLNDLLYAEAQKNNVVVYYVDEGKLNQKEVQTTLSTLLEELDNYHNIFQCHRSFVVNMNNITSAKGNSNGYVLGLGGGLATVPVSRSFVPKLKSYIA